jgi:hypothetical protein
VFTGQEAIHRGSSPAAYIRRGESAGLQGRGTHGQGFGRGNEIGESRGAAAGTNLKIQ